MKILSKSRYTVDRQKLGPTKLLFFDGSCHCTNRTALKIGPHQYVNIQFNKKFWCSVIQVSKSERLCVSVCHVFCPSFLVHIYTINLHDAVTLGVAYDGGGAYLASISHVIGCSGR